MRNSCNKGDARWQRSMEMSHGLREAEFLVYVVALMTFGLSNVTELLFSTTNNNHYHIT
jgi:hypothetical protein